MNDFISGVLVHHSLPLNELHERISESWLRLRFHSPLIAAEVYRDSELQSLGSWVYTAVALEQAIAWRHQSLHFHTYVDGELNGETIEGFIATHIKDALPYD